MKLTIRRNQADQKGIFGGHKGVKFSLYAKVDLRPDELALIERYKVSDWVLTSYEFYIGNDRHERTCTVQNLIAGDTATMKDLFEMQKWEEEIKSGCQTLKQALLLMATFGGEEVIDI